MTTAAAPPRTTRRTAGQSAEQRRARQDELLATLADGVLELTTSDGWLRYLRAMAALRTYSTGNTHISESRECPQLWRVLVSSSQSWEQAGRPVLANQHLILDLRVTAGGDSHRIAIQTSVRDLIIRSPPPRAGPVCWWLLSIPIVNGSTAEGRAGGVVPRTPANKVPTELSAGPDESAGAAPLALTIATEAAVVGPDSA